MENLEIDLMEGIKNPEKAKEIVKAVQATIDELTTISTGALDTAKRALKNSDEFEKQAELLTQVNVNLSTAIKNIHLALNANAEIVDQSTELKDLRLSLAKLVLDSGMIKLGVMSNATPK